MAVPSIIRKRGICMKKLWHFIASPYPADALSNFAAHPFVIDGVHCGGMEGFLQSLKFYRKCKQIQICALFGKPAKKAGAKKKLWKILGIVHWNGKFYKRTGKEFAELISRAYGEMYRQSEDFRRALADTNGATLTHTIGTPDRRKTILTEAEFVNCLNTLRNLQN